MRDGADRSSPILECVHHLGAAQVLGSLSLFSFVDLVINYTKYDQATNNG